METVYWRSLIVLLILVGIVCLQIFLSKREGKWPGLVLPIMVFLFSLMYPLNMAAPASIIQILLVWLIANSPTIILLLIYFACREKKNRRKQVEKMNIQDLD